MPVVPESAAIPLDVFATVNAQKEFLSSGASQDFPVDELPEGRVDPRLHLGFLPVLPEPSGPEGVLRPLQPARPIVVAQDAALSHVVTVGTKEHHVEGEGNFGAPAGGGRHIVEDS